MIGWSGFPAFESCHSSRWTESGDDRIATVGYPESLCNSCDIQEANIPFGPFDAADVSPMKICSSGKK